MHDDGYFDEHVVVGYDDSVAEMFSPAAVSPVVDFLEKLAGEGHVLEFGIGTGQIALRLDILRTTEDAGRFSLQTRSGSSSPCGRKQPDENNLLPGNGRIVRLTRIQGAVREYDSIESSRNWNPRREVLSRQRVSETARTPLRT